MKKPFFQIESLFLKKFAIFPDHNQYSMYFRLQQFRINNLHGDTDVDITIRDNKLIIVSENGFSKTTIVNIIYYTLSRQWFKLTEYEFDNIGFLIDGNEFTILREDLIEYRKLKRLRSGHFGRGQSAKIKSIADFIIENYSLNDLANHPFEIDRIASRLEVPISLVNEIVNELLFSTKRGLYSNNLEEIENSLQKTLKGQILYLPTYRRIEKDLKLIFPDIETNLDALRTRKLNYYQEDQDRYIELVEFGMGDVQAKVERKLNSLYINFTNTLRQSLMGGYLKDLLNKTYEHYNYTLANEITTDKLEEILYRIDDSIIQPKEKQSLKEFVGSYGYSPYALNTENRVIAYFIQKLVDIYDQQSLAEKDVIKFVEICNTYCNNKTFTYSRDERNIKIHLTLHEKEIGFSKLSSGEKQIVSLFSHLYLSDIKNFFVIIDEPELSLSVPWQERFLPDILDAYNDGIIAVTHSPYIFSNKLKAYTKGLNEFITTK